MRTGTFAHQVQAGWSSLFFNHPARPDQVCTNTDFVPHESSHGFVKDHFICWSMYRLVPGQLHPSLYLSATSIFPNHLIVFVRVIIQKLGDTYLACLSLSLLRGAAGALRGFHLEDGLDFTQGDYRLALFQCENPSKQRLHICCQLSRTATHI